MIPVFELDKIKTSVSEKIIITEDSNTTMNDQKTTSFDEYEEYLSFNIQIVGDPESFEYDFFTEYEGQFLKQQLIPPFGMDVAVFVDDLERKLVDFDLAVSGAQIYHDKAVLRLQAITSIQNLKEMGLKGNAVSQQIVWQQDMPISNVPSKDAESLVKKHIQSRLPAKLKVESAE